MIRFYITLASCFFWISATAQEDFVSAFIHSGCRPTAFIVENYNINATEDSSSNKNPDIFKYLNPYGDFRLRGEIDVTPNSNRFRGRLRLRGGVVVTLHPAIQIDFRVITALNAGDPNSPYINFTSGFDKVGIFIDRAYVRFNPQKSKGIKIWLGKFPIDIISSSVYSETVWDADIQPEGGAISYTVDKHKNLNSFNIYNGFFLSSQFKTDIQSTFLNVSQLSANVSMSKVATITIASGVYYYYNLQNYELATSVYDPNAGNKIYEKTEINPDTVITEVYTSDFYISDNFILIKFISLPMPLTMKGQLIYNFGARDDNIGFTVGATYGTLAEKKNWSIYYQYQLIQQESVFSPMVQDDFLSQTNYKGHVFGAAYAFHKKVSLHAWALIDKTANGDTDNNFRIRLDLNLKF